jgi:AraC-like DNA-binding protein
MRCCIEELKKLRQITRKRHINWALPDSRMVGDMSNFFFTTEDKEIEFVYSKDSKTDYNKHNHVSMFVVGIVLNGRLQLCKEGSSVICEADDMILIMPYESHSIKVLDTAYSMLTLCIKNEYMNSEPLSKIKTKLQQHGKRLVQDKIINTSQLEAFIEAFVMIYEMNYIPHNARQTEKIKKMIVEEPENELDIQTMADSIYINKYYFIRKFKEEIGLTPHHFQMQNRIRKAKYLIQEEHKISDVAINCGFFDQSHFVKCFKKYVGMTPIEYEKSIIRL